MQLTIPSMTCGGCARSVTRAIQDVDAHAQVDVNLDTKVVSINTSADQAAVVAALDEAGFTPE